MGAQCLRDRLFGLQDVKLSDLEKIGVLGSGAFGQVMLVKYEGQYMALKTLSKQQIIEMGLQVSSSCLPLRLLACCRYLVHLQAENHAAVH